MGALLCLVGCSALVGGGAPADPPSAPTSLVLSPASPRSADTVVATAAGSLDPAGTAVHYRFEWLRESEMMQLNESTAQNTLAAPLHKGETWNVRVTPVTEDGRTGEPREATFAVGNTAPSLHTVGLNFYRPVSTDIVRAFPSGYSDLDGDPAALRYRWQIGNRAPIETTQPSIDLSTLLPLVDPVTETLSLEVIPSDGQDDSEPVTLGPYPIAPDETSWRALYPTQLLGFADLDFLGGTLGDFVKYDARNRRFIVHVPDSYLVFSQSIWAYRLDGGWAELDPEGTEPELVVAEALYDATVDSERVLVSGFTEAGDFELHALDVTQRGLERWEKLPVSGGPSFRCFFTAHLDADNKALFVYGGVTSNEIPCDDGLAVNELWVLDLSNPEAPVWAPESPLSGLWPIAGATLVVDPTRDDSLLFFGGTVDDGTTPARIHRVEYDLSDINDIDIEFTDLGLTLLFDPWGVSATADPDAGLIVGGLGARQGAVEPAPVDLIWTFDPEVADFSALKYRRTELFDDLDTSLGVAFGESAWEDDRVVFWPGRSVIGASYWGLGEIVPGEAQGQYEWRTLIQRSVDYPAATLQAGWNQTRPIVYGGPVFEFDFSLNGWSVLAPETEGPGPRNNLNGGTALDGGGLWTVGGWQQTPPDMTPWRYESGNWEALSTTAMPPGRVGHTIFETGCGAQRPVGVVGGQGAITKETWLLECPGELDPCTWEEVTGPEPTLGQLRAAVMHDGQDRVVMVSSSQFDQNIYALDPCNNPEAGWQVMTTLQDPVAGGTPWTVHPAAQYFWMNRISDSPGAAEFVFLSHHLTFDTIAWRLIQVGETTYQWDRIETLADGPVRTIGAVSLYDETRQRLLYFTGFRSEMWELRLRD